MYLRNFYKTLIKDYFNSNKAEFVKRKYLDLGILDSSISSSNLGDSIIFESVYKNIREVFKDDIFTTYPTQIHSSFEAKSLIIKYTSKIYNSILNKNVIHSVRDNY